MPKAQVTFEPPRVVGSLEAPVVERELRARRSALQACYERALRDDRNLHGRVVVRFTIGPVGHVTTVSIDEDGLGQPEAIACFQRLAARWNFPAPGTGSVEVVVPVAFSTAE